MAFRSKNISRKISQIKGKALKKGEICDDTGNGY
jgi:hypothetical protein